VSTDAVTEFMHALNQDDELRKRCEEVLGADGPDGVVKLAAERGWEFTADELGESGAIEGELDDDDLESVAGGAQQAHRLTLSPKVFKTSSSSGIARVRNVAGLGGDDRMDCE